MLYQSRVEYTPDNAIFRVSIEWFISRGIWHMCRWRRNKIESSSFYHKVPTVIDGRSIATSYDLRACHGLDCRKRATLLEPTPGWCFIWQRISCECEIGDYLVGKKWVILLPELAVSDTPEPVGSKGRGSFLEGWTIHHECTERDRLGDALLTRRMPEYMVPGPKALCIL